MMQEGLSRRCVLHSGLAVPFCGIAPAIAGTKTKLVRHDRAAARAAFARILATWNAGDVAAFNALGPVVLKVDDIVLDEPALAKFISGVAPERKRPDFKPIELEKFDRVTGSPNLQLYLASLKLHAFAAESEQECYTEHDGSSYCSPTGWYQGFALWYVLFDGPRLVSLTHKLTMF